MPSIKVLAPAERTAGSWIPGAKSKINVALLKKTLARIEAEPEHWNQSWWRCGTSYCFGGWAAVLAGAKFRRPDENMSIELIPKYAWEKNRPYVVMHDRAQYILGLTNYEASELFFSGNSLADLKRIVRKLIRRAEKEATAQ
jgi:hypothetical protein